jgi:protein-S-isoprenylcysteine O-methyltransferase Ste14
MSKPLMMLLSLVSTGAWLLLAVLGWGGFGAFFANPARIALVLCTALMLVAAFFSDAGIRSGEREDRANRWIFIPLIVISVLAGWLPAWCDRTETLTLDGDIVRWLGVLLFAVGGVLRLVPVFVLGRRFSGLVAIQPGHTLMTSGIYGSIRHPSYLGLIMMMFGWALAFRALLGVVLAALAVAVLVARMNSEEALLGEQFGAEYAAYKARTYRLIPGVY